MKTRIGYGHLDAPYWYVGIEEAGKPDERDERMAAPGIEDLHMAHYGKFGGRYNDHFQGSNAKLQPTWANLIRAHLVALGCDAPSLKQIREYQATRWGRSDGDTLLTELYPLASPSFKNNPARTLIRPDRIRFLRDLFAEHCPKFVIADGTTGNTRQHFKEIFGRTDTKWSPLPGDPGAGEVSGKVALVVHPVRQKVDRFCAVGQWARQFVREDR